MPEYLTPGVYFEPQDRAQPVIRRVRTDIAGFVGLAERGPLNWPVQIDSWRHFQARFGGFVPWAFLAYAVKGFFENGGRTCFVVRAAGQTAARAELRLKDGAGAEVLRVRAIDEGTWGNRIAVTLTLARPAARTFSMVVTRDGRDRESFPDLSIDPADRRYVARIVAEGDPRTERSAWIEVEDLMPATAPRTAGQLPDPVASGLSFRTGFLAGGADGVASLSRFDLLGTGDQLAVERVGLSALDRVDAVAIVCLPDMHARPAPAAPPPPPIPEPPRDPCRPAPPPVPTATPPPALAFEQPPGFTLDEIASMQRALIEHCERRKDRVAVLEVPLRPGGQPFTIAETLDWRSRLESERGYGALYHPWVRVVDPGARGDAPQRTVPPCGHVAGLYAREDFEVGVHRAPANAELHWAEDLAAQIGDLAQEVLNPEGVNCLRAFPGRGIRVYGARTVSSDPDWRYVNVRRLMLMIEEAVDESTQWSVFEPHDFALRQTLVISVSGFLETVWRQGGLVGASPEEAFFVKCDETNNPPSSVDQGRLIVDVGVAPTQPAEFIVFRVGRTVDELELVER